MVMIKWKAPRIKIKRELSCPRTVDVYKRQAMALYGSDKPDTRFEMLLQDLTELVKGVDFKVFSEAPAAVSYTHLHIDQMGLPEKSPVVVFGGQEYEMLATFVALTKSGHAYIPRCV